MPGMALISQGNPFVMPGTLLSRKSPPKRISHSKYQKWRRHSVSSNGLIAKELIGTNLTGYNELENRSRVDVVGLQNAPGVPLFCLSV